MKPSQKRKPQTHYRLRHDQNIVPRIGRMMPANPRRYRNLVAAKKNGSAVGEFSGRWRYSRLRIVTKPVAFWVRRSIKELFVGDSIEVYDQVFADHYREMGREQTKVVQVKTVGDPRDRIVQITGIVRVNA